MNKKLAYVLCVGAVASLTLAGCGGKSAKEELSEQYQEELDLEEEDADELAEIAEEIYEEEAAEEQAEAEQEAEAQSSFKLYDATSEIKNSKLTDEIVQVGGVVLPNDGTMTVGELVEKLQENGAVTVKSEHTGKITEESLVTATTNGVEEYLLLDEFDNEICRIDYVNDTSDIIGAYECKVVEIKEPDGYGNPNSLNFFYPGDICAGVYNNFLGDWEESEELAKRLEEYPKITYQNIEDTLKAKGIENVDMQILTDTPIYSFVLYSKNPMYKKDGEDCYRKQEYNFGIDMATATVGYISVHDSYNIASRAVEEILDDLSGITPEVVEQMESYCIGALKDIDLWNFESRANETATLEGYFIIDTEDIHGIYAACHTDKGTYEAVRIPLNRYSDGSCGVEEYKGIPSVVKNSYDSFDAILEDFEVKPENVVRLD